MKVGAMLVVVIMSGCGPSAADRAHIRQAMSDMARMSVRGDGPEDMRREINAVASNSARATLNRCAAKLQADIAGGVADKTRERSLADCLREFEPLL